MKTLVTGGAGFLGKAIALQLLKRGESVRSLDLVAADFSKDLQGGAEDTVDQRVGDILDTACIEKAMEGVDAVVHCAAIPHLWQRDARQYERVNIEGARRVARAAKEAGVTRFVHISSYVTFMGTRNRRKVVTEADQLSTKEMVGPYPFSKRMSENAVLAAGGDDMTVVIVLPSAPLGAGDMGMTPPTKMLCDLLNGAIPATLNCMLNFVDLQSLAEGVVLARDKGVHGQRYFLTDQDLEMAEFLVLLSQKSVRKMPSHSIPNAVAHLAALIEEGLIARFTGREPKALLTGVRIAKLQVRFDNAKAKSELGWAPRSIDHALDESLAWLDESGLLDHPLRSE